MLNLILMSMMTFAGNSRFEGLFYNESTEAMVCLKNNDQGCLTQIVIPTGRLCKGDGALLASGIVFKIPDHTMYICDSESCGAMDITSTVLFEYAQYANGEEKYGPMTLEKFESFFPQGYCK